MSLAKPTDFLLNTDYEMDKIVYFYEGKIASGTGEANISHTFNFCPLAFGFWSTTEDFSEPHPFSYSSMLNPYTYEPLYPNVGLTSNYGNLDSEKYFYVDKWNAKNIDIWIRIYAFEPGYSHANLASTSKYANTFILNTDYNYRKIAKSGMVDCVRDTGQNSRYYYPIEVEHKLGYIPQVMVWQESMETYDNIAFSQLLGRQMIMNNWSGVPTNEKFQGVKVDSNKITIFPDNTLTDNGARIHYRIYYDEAQ